MQTLKKRSISTSFQSWKKLHSCSTDDALTSRLYVFMYQYKSVHLYIPSQPRLSYFLAFDDFLSIWLIVSHSTLPCLHLLSFSFSAFFLSIFKHTPLKNSTTSAFLHSKQSLKFSAMFNSLRKFTFLLHLMLSKYSLPPINYYQPFTI